MLRQHTGSREVRQLRLRVSSAPIEYRSQNDRTVQGLSNGETLSIAKTGRSRPENPRAVVLSLHVR